MKKIYEKGNSDWYAEVFKIFENGLNGQLKTDFHQTRQNAMETFRQLGFPTTRHEEWKYTNLSSLLNHNFEISKVVDEDKLPYKDIDKHLFNDSGYPLLVFVNGYFMPALSNIENLPDEIEVMSLEQALKSNHPSLRDHYSRYALTEAESFISLNTAFVQDGTLINIPDNMIADLPIHLLYLTLPEEKPSVSFTRNLIVTGSSSHVTFVEHFSALSPGNLFYKFGNRDLCG